MGGGWVTRAWAVLFLASTGCSLLPDDATGDGDVAAFHASSPPGNGTGPLLASSLESGEAHLAHCGPRADAPAWLTEGEHLHAKIVCSTGLVDPAFVFSVSQLPPGATFDASSGELDWTPGLDQAGVYSFTLTESSTGELGTLKVGVADAFTVPGNAPVDPSTYTEEYGLPVMHLSFPGDLSSEEKRPAQLVYRGHTYSIDARYHGATSLDFPKKSYSFEFSDADEFEDPAVGFGHRDELAVITTFDDNSYVRIPLAFELWHRMDPANIEVKTFPLVLFVNGAYQGLYFVVDHVDSDLIKRAGLPKGGDLFKAWHEDANFNLVDAEGKPKTSLAQGFEKKAGTPKDGEPGAYQQIEDLTQFVATSSDADFLGHFDEWLNRRDYENWWIFVTLTYASDSGGKNAYHYRAPDGSPFRYIPWDFDATFGQQWDTRRTGFDWRYHFVGKNKLFERMLEQPTLLEPMLTRYAALLDGPLKKSEVLAVYDALQAKVHDAAVRDELRWGAEYRTFPRWSDRTDLNNYEEEAAYVRKWIDTRWDSLQNDGVW